MRGRAEALRYVTVEGQGWSPALRCGRAGRAEALRYVAVVGAGLKALRYVAVVRAGLKACAMLQS